MLARAESIASVLDEHALECAHLYRVRDVLVCAPQARLFELRRHDERILAHLDGLIVAGDAGAQACDAALGEPGIGEVFTAAVRALQCRDGARLDALWARAAEAPAIHQGLIGALAWVSAEHLRGVVAALLSSTDPLRREAGIATCAAHEADPGETLDRALRDDDPAVRTRALDAAGELGARSRLPACRAALGDAHPPARFAAARAAVLLGDRGEAVETLGALFAEPGPWREPALEWLLRLADLPGAQQILRGLARDPSNLRLLIRGAGIAGDAAYAGWLLRQMHDARLARLAGEAFCLITGVNLSDPGLHRARPADHGAAQEAPDDDDVALEADEGLMWPEPEALREWWNAHAAQFAAGIRYFVGAPLEAAHCTRVLTENGQRQRIAAARWRSLLQPGTALFNTAAPTRRQQRLLARLS